MTLTLDRIERRLAAGLQRTLPGLPAQLRLSPRPRRGWKPGELPDGLRQGAVLLLVYPDRQRQARLLLTLRTGHLQNHAGQVSLPGGAAEPGETLEHAALREVHEEVGVDPAAVRVLGSLTALHVPVSRFALHPFVGVLDHRPDWRPDHVEVERVLEPTVHSLLDPSSVAVERRTRGGVTYDVPVIQVEGEKVWGATAMVLAEFLALLDHRRRPGNEETGA